jgi:hypothetical protein
MVFILTYNLNSQICTNHQGGPLTGIWSYGSGIIYNQCFNVGINTNLPSFNLDVNGTARINRFLLGSNIDASTVLTSNGATMFFMKSPSLYLTSTSTTFADNNLFRIENNLGKMFEIDYTGKVRITPTLQSSVVRTVFLIENLDRKLFQIENNGLVRAREIKVDLATNWPDYVFSKNYVLKPLSEIKEFIDLNGHLPGVLSAKEIEEDGIPLGEMNRILLEKVEELTLYSIEQEYRMIALQKQIDELKTWVIEKREINKN